MEITKPEAYDLSPLALQQLREEVESLPREEDLEYEGQTVRSEKTASYMASSECPAGEMYKLRLVELEHVDVIEHFCKLENILACKKIWFGDVVRETLEETGETYWSVLMEVET